jgi:hypothetical protein
MPRKSNWNGSTTVIRIPEHCADDLVAIAKLLDCPHGPDWYEFDDLVREIKRTKHEHALKQAGIPICKPKTDPETIAQGLSEGWIKPKKPLPTCPLLACCQVGDRAVLHGKTGQLEVSYGPGEGDMKVVFATDCGIRTVFNRTAAADIQPLEAA